jgi:hypothetical protein
MERPRSASGCVEEELMALEADWEVNVFGKNRAFAPPSSFPSNTDNNQSLAILY